MSKKDNKARKNNMENENAAAETAETVKAPEAEKTEEPKNAGPGPEELLAAEKDRYLRLAAEYDNYRKRSQKEHDMLFSMVKSDTVLNFLPVYDNLERALELKTADEAFYKGIEMTMVQLKDIFTKLGVAPIDALGKKFDANLHNAVMHIDDETKGEGEIVEEFQKGFTLGDKVIRFSMVKVAN